MRRKRIVAVVDNQSEFMANFEKVIKKVNLGEKFELKYFEISDHEDIKRRIDDLKKIRYSLSAIIVDIVMFELREPIDLSGINIANEIRREFPNLPIFLATGHLDNSYLPIIVWGSLEDIDGVLIKQYVCREKNFTEKIKFEKEDIETIIQKGTKKRSAYIAGSLSTVSEDIEQENYKKLLNLLTVDNRSSKQIKEEIGSTVFIHLIESFFSALKISSLGRSSVGYFRPGFSGSFLFRIATRQNGDSWLLKVDHAEKIEKEVGNYRKIYDRFPKAKFLPVVEDYVNYGKWAAFGIKIEENVITLADYLDTTKVEQNAWVVERLGEILKTLYGKQRPTSTRFWKDSYYTWPSKTYVRLMAFFEEQLVRELYNHEKLEELRNFVHTHGDLPFLERPHFICEGNIHGDLNAKNILLRPNSKEMVIIDFANYREGDHVTKDIAKLESDIIFSVLDRNRKEYYDWNRISDLEKMFKSLSLKNIFDSTANQSLKKERIGRIWEFVMELRRGLKGKICPSVKADEYLNSLLYYSFQCLTYPDVSIQRKLFGLEWVYRIITELKNSRG